MTGNCPDKSSGSDIPNPEGAILASGHDPGTVWTDGTAPYIVGMTNQGAEFGAGGGVPDFEGVIPTGGDDPGTIWTYRTTPYLIGMADKGV